MWPWYDQSGRFSAFKLAVLVALCVPAVLVAADFVLGQLGPRPYNTALRQFGLWCIRFLFIALAVTPLASIANWPKLFEVRRMIGVGAAAYIVIHLVLYMGQEKWRLLHVGAEIAVRIYLTIGFVGLVGLVVLAVTSTDGMMRRLGRKWARLHRTIYFIAVMAIVHFFIQSKANVAEPLMMTGFYLWLMGWRGLARRAPRRRPGARALVGLGLAVVVLTALGEAGYYHFKTGVDVARVLAVNFDPGAGLRPAWGVVAAALAMTVILALRGRDRRRLAAA
jgi:sulfoxide reductase heme-binding subunit YedZ